MQHDPPQETIPKPRARRHRCPCCRATFETLRLSRLACPECGHAWEARLGENRLGDAITNLSEHAVMAFGFLLLLVLVLFVAAVAVRWVGIASEGRGVVAAAIVVVLLLTGTTVSICSPNLRNWRKLSRSHATSSPADAQIARLNGGDLARIQRVDPEFRHRP